MVEEDIFFRNIPTYLTYLCSGHWRQTPSALSFVLSCLVVFALLCFATSHTLPGPRSQIEINDGYHTPIIRSFHPIPAAFLCELPTYLPTYLLLGWIGWDESSPALKSLHQSGYSATAPRAIPCAPAPPLMLYTQNPMADRFSTSPASFPSPAPMSDYSWAQARRTSIDTGFPRRRRNLAVCG